MLFFASAVSFLLVTVGGKTVWLPVVGMLLSNAAMGTANSVIFNMYCLRFRETGHVSSVSGLLDSACYAASAAANMLFTVVISAAGFGSAGLVFVVSSWYCRCIFCRQSIQRLNKALGVLPQLITARSIYHFRAFAAPLIDTAQKSL